MKQPIVIVATYYIKPSVVTIVYIVIAASNWYTTIVTCCTEYNCYLISVLSIVIPVTNVVYVPLLWCK